MGVMRVVLPVDPAGPSSGSNRVHSGRRLELRRPLLPGGVSAAHGAPGGRFDFLGFRLLRVAQ